MTSVARHFIGVDLHKKALQFCVMLDDSYHMISIDREKARVLSEMKDFMHGTSAGAVFEK